MANFLLLAGPATEPARFIGLLHRHPDITAVSRSGVGDHLFSAARARIRTCRGAGGDPSLEDVVTQGRAEGRRALERLFDDVRQAGRTPVVVLHDPSGPMFPFHEPPALSLLVLVRNAESAAAAIGAVGVERVVAAVREALAAFQTRVASFGIAPERMVTVEEDRLTADPAAGLAEVCRTLGVAADPATLWAMLDPARVDARSGGGA